MRASLWNGSLAVLGIAACAGYGCYGHIGDGAGTDVGPSGGDPNPNGTAPAGATVGQTAIRRLGKTELLHTLRDLLPALPAGFESTVELPADNDVQLAFSLPGTVSDVEGRRFMDLAEAAIAALGGSSPGAQLSCGGANETDCARSFVTSFGKRAFRRPLDPVEVDDLMALFGKLRSDPGMAYGVPDAVNLVVEAILQSPGFLYRWERGLAAPQMDGALVKYDSYEMASRLSYFIWKSMPDDALMAAADAAALTTADEIAAQARRLLEDPKADETLSNFTLQWLELGPLEGLFKDTATYPTYNAQIPDAMRAETLAFSRDVLRGSSPTLVNLLTARYTFVDSTLASYYGVTPDASGHVDLTGTPRLGLLTEGALMAVKGNSYRTSPVRRGKFVLNRLLCQIVPPPPPNVVPALPPPDPNLTVRQQMDQHASNPACAGCHTKMDSIGYAFEHFDGAGNYQATDRGMPIDTTGAIDLDGATVAFRDAAELATALASSREVHECFTRQWLRYALDRFEQDADADAVTHLKTFYEGSSLNTRDLIVEITRTLPFTHRAPAQSEVLTP
jgi:hypothetical protein